MQIIDTLVDSVSDRARASRLLDVRVGAHYTIVVVELPIGPNAGLAATMHRGEHPIERVSELVGAETWLGRTPLELLALAHRQDTIEAGIGLATINALIAVDEAACTEVNAGDLILGRGAGKRVAIVGHFPFVPQVREVARQCDVLELHLRPGDLPADRASDVIPHADVVAITGTTLLNGTFDGLIALCRRDAYVLVLGGSTPLSPLLFPLGVDVVAGTRLTDIEGAMRAVGDGAGFRQIPGKRLLVLEKASPDSGRTAPVSR